MNISKKYSESGVNVYDGRVYRKGRSIGSFLCFVDRSKGRQERTGSTHPGMKFLIQSGVSSPDDVLNKR